MKKTIYLLLACMLLPVIVAAQNVVQSNSKNNSSIYIAKDEKTGKEVVSKSIWTSLHDAVSMVFMEPEEVTKRFGKDWVGKVTVAVFNQSVELSTLTEFCKKHKLNNKLPMVLAGKFYRDTTAANVLFDASRVTSFEQKRDSIFIHMNFDKRK